MTFDTLGVPGLICKYMINSGPKGVISFLYAHHMIEMGCLSYLTYVRDQVLLTTSHEFYLVCSRVHGCVFYRFI